MSRLTDSLLVLRSHREIPLSSIVFRVTFDPRDVVPFLLVSVTATQKGRIEVLISTLLCRTSCPRTCRWVRREGWTSWNLLVTQGRCLGWTHRVLLPPRTVLEQEEPCDTFRGSRILGEKVGVHPFLSHRTRTPTPPSANPSSSESIGPHPR